VKWDYRVVKKTNVCDLDGNYVGFGIHEVYYDADGVPTMCTEDTVEPWGETLEELESDMKRYFEALQKPVLIFEEIGVKSDPSVVG
jgi:hypothetical protein